MLAQLEQQVRGVVIENLQEMLKRQKAIRQATEFGRAENFETRKASIQLQQLGPAEKLGVATICRQTRELVTETQFSVVLPPVLETLEKSMLYVSGDLSGGRGDRRVIGAETAIEQDLQDLLETFQETPSSAAGECNGECKGCKGNMNKLLAELKVVRMMQMGREQGDDRRRLRGPSRRSGRRSAAGIWRKDGKSSRRPRNDSRRDGSAARAIRTMSAVEAISSQRQRIWPPPGAIAGTRKKGDS